MREKNLTEGGILKTMLIFSIPMILGNLLQQIYNIADTMVVGHFVGAEALAAVGSAYTHDIHNIHNYRIMYGKQCRFFHGLWSWK